MRPSLIWAAFNLLRLIGVIFTIWALVAQFVAIAKCVCGCLFHLLICFSCFCSFFFSLAQAIRVIVELTRSVFSDLDGYASRSSLSVSALAGTQIAEFAHAASVGVGDGELDNANSTIRVTVTPTVTLTTPASTGSANPVDTSPNLSSATDSSPQTSTSPDGSGYSDYPVPASDTGSDGDNHPSPDADDVIRRRLPRTYPSSHVQKSRDIRTADQVDSSNEYFGDSSVPDQPGGVVYVCSKIYLAIHRR